MDRKQEKVNRRQKINKQFKSVLISAKIKEEIMGIGIDSVVAKEGDPLKRKWLVRFVTEGGRCTLKSEDPDNENCWETENIKNLIVI